MHQSSPAAHVTPPPPASGQQPQVQPPLASKQRPHLHQLHTPGICWSACAPGAVTQAMPSSPRTATPTPRAATTPASEAQGTCWARRARPAATPAPAQRGAQSGPPSARQCLAPGRWGTSTRARCA
eukprot:11729-Chlamydomonas_euryale.AAC.1